MTKDLVPVSEGVEGETPQMFAALAELLAERNGGALHGPLPDTFGVALARAAIAKAEGR